MYPFYAYPKGVFEVLATGGDTALGGDDFDHLLAEWLKNQQSHLKMIVKNVNLLSLQTKLKVALTTNDKIRISYAEQNLEIMRDEFNSLISGLVKRSLLACRRTLKDANLTPSDILEVVMVGGSTRIPYVRRQVGEFCLHLRDFIDPDSGGIRCSYSGGYFSRK